MVKDGIMAENHSTITNPSAFPLGAPNDAYAKYFIGQSYLAPLVSGKEVNVSNVTFEAGCRNNWHIHHKACQILIAVGGRGYYQEWGKEPVELNPGDVVYVAPETKHWHGAAPNSNFAHIAIMNVVDGASNEWLEPVEAEYDALRGQSSNISPAAEEYHHTFFPNSELLRQDDPDLAEIIENFAFDEVPNEPGVNDLDDKTRYLAILATLLGSQSLTEFRGIVPAAMIAGLTPVEIKEATYQAVAYLGIARVYPFIAALNEVLRARRKSHCRCPRSPPPLPKRDEKPAPKPKWISSARA